MSVILRVMDGSGREFELSDEEFERFELIHEDDELIGGDNE